MITKAMFIARVVALLKRLAAHDEYRMRGGAFFCVNALVAGGVDVDEDLQLPLQLRIEACPTPSKAPTATGAGTARDC